MIICFLNIKNSLELTDTKCYITFNETIPYWGLHGLAIWIMFVNDYMLFFNIKNSLELTDTKAHITFNEPIPYWGLQGQALNDLCKWLYAFWISKTALSWLIQKVIFTFNEPIPYWGLHGLAIWMMFANNCMLFEYEKSPWVDWYKI